MIVNAPSEPKWTDANLTPGDPCSAICNIDCGLPAKSRTCEAAGDHPPRGSLKRGVFHAL